VVEVFTSKKKFVIYKAAFMVSAEWHRETGNFNFLVEYINKFDAIFETVDWWENKKKVETLFVSSMSCVRISHTIVLSYFY
jgi:hypothetical protein